MKMKTTKTSFALGYVAALCFLAFGFGAPEAVAGRTVTDATGHAVEIPDRVHRVVALSEIDLDICLALGLEPVGTINGRGQKSLPRYLSDEMKSAHIERIPVIGDIGRPNIEAVIRLKPDLILTSPSRPQTLALLRKIAPTFVSFDNGDPWQKVFFRVADVLGKEGEAREFMARYRKALSDARKRLSGFENDSVSIVRWNPKGPAFMLADSFASLVLRDMGFKRPKAQQVPGQKHSMPLSLEALHMIDADWLFIGTLDSQSDAAEAMREIAKSAAFQRLESVKNQRYHPVDGSKWTSIGGPLAALSIVHETTRQMTAAGKEKPQ